MKKESEKEIATKAEEKVKRNKNYARTTVRDLNAEKPISDE